MMLKKIQIIKEWLETNITSITVDGYTTFNDGELKSFGNGNWGLKYNIGRQKSFQVYISDDGRGNSIDSLKRNVYTQIMFEQTLGVQYRFANFLKENIEIFDTIVDFWYFCSTQVKNIIPHDIINGSVKNMLRYLRNNGIYLAITPIVTATTLGPIVTFNYSILNYSNKQTFSFDNQMGVKTNFVNYDIAEYFTIIKALELIK